MRKEGNWKENVFLKTPHGSMDTHHGKGTLIIRKPESGIYHIQIQKTCRTDKESSIVNREPHDKALHQVEELSKSKETR